MVVRLDTLPTPLEQRVGQLIDIAQNLSFLHNLAGDNSEEATPDPHPELGS